MVVFVPFKYQSIAKYVLKAKSSIICINKMVSKVWFDKLPRDIQSVIMEEAAKADKFIIGWSEALTKKLYGIWAKTGGVITELSDKEQAAFKDMIRRIRNSVTGG